MPFARSDHASSLHLSLVRCCSTKKFVTSTKRRESSANATANSTDTTTCQRSFCRRDQINTNTHHAQTLPVFLAPTRTPPTQPPPITISNSDHITPSQTLALQIASNTHTTARYAPPLHSHRLAPELNSPITTLGRVCLLHSRNYRPDRKQAQVRGHLQV